MSEEFKTERVVFRTNIINSYSETAINSIEDVPIGNKDAVDVLMSGGKRDEFINSMKLGDDYPAHPDSYTTFIMTKEWAESFAQHVNTTPKPLFIGGHAEYSVSAKERAIPDGYLIGAKVIDNTLYLRNAFPEGNSEQQKALFKQTMNEIKAGMLSTSISDIMKYKIVRDDESYDSTYYATESLKGQSNALVEHDMPASEAQIIITSFKSGSSDGSELSDERGAEHMGDENKTLTTEVLFTSLKNRLETGTLALPKVAEELGIDLMTSKQKTALKRLNDAESKVGDISEFVESVMAEREASFKEMKDLKLKEKFKDDALIEVAETMFSLKAGTADEIDAELDKISSLQVFKNIQGATAASINSNPGGQGAAVIEEIGTMEG